MSLITLDGSINALGSGPHIRAADHSLLKATNLIGSLSNPFDVLLSGGDLFIDIGGGRGILTGTGTLVFNRNRTTGEIHFNGKQLWPISNTRSIEEINLLTKKRIDQGTLANLRVMSFDYATPLFYAYHPITKIDISSFDGITLDPEAYEFIEDRIKFNRPLSPYFDKTKEDNSSI